ncbi:MAG TPA: DNA repair protein RadC [Candidatus Sulfotelmatobacter sp.]|jgi:DNA repair protein RadC|nr:DNA repair protein RadC [Candidatus Sulfotelmatobacter sp.]
MKVFSQQKRRKLRIKDMPLTLRPRERLFQSGAKNLSDVELLAILLGTGSSKQNALVLGDKLLRQFSLQKLNTQLKELVKYPGVGSAKAARIIAALELGERLFAPASITKIIIRTVQDVLSQVRDIADKRQEYLIVLYLNARHELVLKEVVGMGSLTSLQITPKEIFSHALQVPCASLIVVHNHPSNDSNPSDEDIHFTRRIQEAGEVMGIPLVDHVIVSKSGFYSFREDKE